MSTICTHCRGEGFLNLDVLNDDVDDLPGYSDLDWDDPDAVKAWVDSLGCDDVAVCDCCGNGTDTWYGEPGYHYGHDDPPGPNGPYAYNGGLCECH